MSREHSVCTYRFAVPQFIEIEPDVVHSHAQNCPMLTPSSSINSFYKNEYDTGFENDCLRNVIIVVMKTKSYSLGPDFDLCPYQCFLQPYVYLYVKIQHIYQQLI